MKYIVSVCLKLIILFPVLFCLSNCAEVVIGGAAKTIAVSKEVRSIGEFVDDTLIKTRIKNIYFDTNENIFFNVDVEVNQGRVMLTGTVDNIDLRIESTRIAWGAEGVNTVINELQVTDSDSILDFADDLVINAKIKTKILLDNQISYLNYTIETVNGIVYLMGIALSEKERQKVLEVSRGTFGVVEVIDYINVKSSS